MQITSVQLGKETFFILEQQINLEMMMITPDKHEILLNIVVYDNFTKLIIAILVRRDCDI